MQIVDGTQVSLDWLLPGDGGDAPVMRGQFRSEATLAEDVAEHVGREAARLVSRGFPDAEVAVNGERLLAAAAQQVARNYEACAARVIASSAALMPVMELAVEFEQLADSTARDISDPSAAAHWREHAKKRAERAQSAVSQLPYDLEGGTTDRSLHLSVDPGAYIPIPTSSHHLALVTRAGRGAARPFVPPAPDA